LASAQAQHEQLRAFRIENVHTRDDLLRYCRILLEVLERDRYRTDLWQTVELLLQEIWRRLDHLGLSHMAPEEPEEIKDLVQARRAVRRVMRWCEEWQQEASGETSRGDGSQPPTPQEASAPDAAEGLGGLGQLPSLYERFWRTYYGGRKDSHPQRPAERSVLRMFFAGVIPEPVRPGNPAPGAGCAQEVGRNPLPGGSATGSSLPKSGKPSAGCQRRGTRC
jgi:hypothetical protein